MVDDEFRAPPICPYCKHVTHGIFICPSCRRLTVDPPKTKSPRRKVQAAS